MGSSDSMAVNAVRPRVDARIGTVVLGRYRVVAYLAAGGMGAIYLARAEGSAGFVRPVVIKRLLSTGDALASRLFAREARILSRLRHPAIVSVHAFARDGNDEVMVLDYVHGYTLSEWVSYRRRRGQSLPVELAVHAVRRVLEALQYAHTMHGVCGQSLGVIHRDIKPSNVLIDVEGDVKLADFGVARTESEVTDVSASAEVVKGTFSYMAPELFGRAPPSPVTDVYSAAVMLYAVLAGANPFSDAEVAVVVGRALNHEPPPLHRVRDDVPEALAEVIATGMSKRPRLRFPTAGAFAAALRACSVDDDAVEARFRQAVATDFRDAAFAEMLGVPSLDERAAALSGRRATAAAPAPRSPAPPLAPPPTARPVTRLRAVGAPSRAAEPSVATRVDRRVVLNMPVFAPLAAVPAVMAPDAPSVTREVDVPAVVATPRHLARDSDVDPHMVTAETRSFAVVGAAAAALLAPRPADRAQRSPHRAGLAVVVAIAVPIAVGLGALFGLMW